MTDKIMIGFTLVIIVIAVMFGNKLDTLTSSNISIAEATVVQARIINRKCSGYKMEFE